MTTPAAADDPRPDPLVGGQDVATEPLAEDERSELMWLRTENTLLRVERDILIRVASGYAMDMDPLLRQRTPGSVP
jgi:hypothetical protein